MKKVEALSIRETVFKQIRKAILDREFKPGQKLIESELAEQLGVSRTPVREALHKLELEGLVEIYPRKYCLVKGITYESIKEINLIRAQLEPVAARYAVDHLTDHELHYLGTLLDQSVRYHERRDVENLMRVNDAFHQTIIQASHLNRVIKILENMHDYIVSFRYSFMSRPELVERSIREHRLIYSALQRRDYQDVERLVREHLEGIAEYEEVVLEDTEGCEDHSCF